MNIRLVGFQRIGLLSALIALLTNCVPPFFNQTGQGPSTPTQQCETLDTPKPAIVSSVRILHENSVPVRSMMQRVPQLEAAWQEKVDYYAEHRERSTWLTQLYVSPTSTFDIERFVVNPVRVSPEKRVNGFLLVRNEWGMRHSLRLVFLVNYRQLEVQTQGEATYHYLDLPALSPGAERAVPFSLPGLPRGFHQLSILGVTDPDSTSRDPEFRLLQSKSLFEIREDIWVGMDRLPSEVVLFKQPEKGMLSTNQHGDTELIADPETFTNEALAELEMESGEHHCVTLRFFNCGVECRARPQVNIPYTGPYPLKIAVFWDDVMAKAYEFELQPTTRDNYTFDIKIQAPSAPGNYQFSVVAFPLPGYSQFNNQVDRTIFTNTSFSRRIPVEISE